MRTARRASGENAKNGVPCGAAHRVLRGDAEREPLQLRALYTDSLHALLRQCTIEDREVVERGVMRVYDVGDERIAQTDSIRQPQRERLERAGPSTREVDHGRPEGAIYRVEYTMSGNDMTK